MRISGLLREKGDFVATVTPAATVAEVLSGLAEHAIGALIVTEDAKRIVGIVSERDIARALHRDGPAALTRSVTDVMTADVRTCGPDDTVDSLMALMTERRIRHVPVVVEGELVGIVSIGDVVKHRVHELEHENSALVEYIQSGR
ncbi:MAG TPA: CBS domain-containing protein [Acidimicrobiales bacterium]|nr:CBS domain-containing protein [Acidimicrobiales bacterium]